MKNIFINHNISILIISVIFFWSCNNNEDIRSINEQSIPVKTIKVTKTKYTYSNAYSGTIEESESQSLGFSVVGTISKVYVSEGDYIKKGQLLAEIDNSTYKNTYEIMLSKKNQAEDAYKRLEPMYKNGTLPEIKMVEIETSLNEAKSALAIAKKNLDDCKLYAPTNGFIGKRLIDPGMNVTGSLLGITIIKIDKVYAKISVPENEISNFKKGEKAEIFISALNENFIGIVEEIGVVGDIFSHTYKVKIAINNKDYKIKPGMIASIKINHNFNSDKIIIPSQAILNDNDNKPYVFIITNNKTYKQHVETGKIINNGIEIVNGLKENDEIVINGHQKLVNGSLVTVIN